MIGMASVRSAADIRSWLDDNDPDFSGHGKSFANTVRFWNGIRESLRFFQADQQLRSKLVARQVMSEASAKPHVNVGYLASFVPSSAGGGKLNRLVLAIRCATR
ncbi:hypothetical protein PLA107_032235 (plasmid) [Pseudomonas amygdali pv. lachrymans str. M301315]|uniref:Uncharacterized protein n=1 Tax=Pseudomonas amygdali pv. lachrymans str. M301315 TaxID=629260 RepID=A0AAD0PW98_PSEAV|nr:hypothetical protein PLA107_032235 [Pseudomonas amygdali pv. lachrymans str. M301315]